MLRPLLAAGQKTKHSVKSGNSRSLLWKSTLRDTYFLSQTCSLNGVERKYWSTSPSCAERYARVRTMRLSRSSRSGVGGHCWENRIPSAIWAEKTRKANAQHSRSTLKARNLESIHGSDATNYQTEAGPRNGVALDSQKVGIVATHITIPVDMASGRMHMAVTHPQHYAFGTRYSKS